MGKQQKWRDDIIMNCKKNKEGWDILWRAGYSNRIDDGELAKIYPLGSWKAEETHTFHMFRWFEIL
jgi:hypothetical protein